MCASLKFQRLLVQASQQKNYTSRICVVCALPHIAMPEAVACGSVPPGKLQSPPIQPRGHWPTTRGWRPNGAVRARKPSEHSQASLAAKTLHALLAIRRL
jgi:hypothetical protein